MRFQPLQQLLLLEQCRTEDWEGRRWDWKQMCHDILMCWNKTSGQSGLYVHKTSSWYESIYYTYLSCWWFLFFWIGLIFFSCLFYKMKNLEGKVKFFIKLLFLVEKLEKIMGGSTFIQTKWFFLFFSALVAHNKLCSHCSNMRLVPNPLFYVYTANLTCLNLFHIRPRLTATVTHFTCWHFPLRSFCNY